jgi:hypothetical protein
MTSLTNFNQHFKSTNVEQSTRGLINYLGNVVQNHVIFYPTSNSLIEEFKSLVLYVV